MRIYNLTKENLKLFKKRNEEIYDQGRASDFARTREILQEQNMCSDWRNKWNREKRVSQIDKIRYSISLSQ